MPYKYTFTFRRLTRKSVKGKNREWLREWHANGDSSTGQHVIIIGSQLLGHSYWVTVIGSQLLGHSYWVTVIGSQLLGHSYWVTVIGSQLLGHSYWVTVIESHITVLKDYKIYPILEISSWKILDFKFIYQILFKFFIIISNIYHVISTI